MQVLNALLVQVPIAGIDLNVLFDETYGNNRLIGFARPSQFRCFLQCRHIQSDGKFDDVPRLRQLRQLYTFHGKINGYF